MFVLKIMQKKLVKGQSIDYMDEKTLEFEAESINTLLNTVEYMSCLRSDLETEYTILKKEVGYAE